MKQLDAGDIFPSMTIDLVNGGSLAVPDGMASKFKIVLFYRGHW